MTEMPWWGIPAIYTLLLAAEFKLGWAEKELEVTRRQANAGRLGLLLAPWIAYYAWY